MTHQCTFEVNDENDNPTLIMNMLKQYSSKASERESLDKHASVFCCGKLKPALFVFTL